MYYIMREMEKKHFMYDRNKKNSILHLVLNSEFNNGEYKIINTQDDMGNENIRRTKLSYNPVCIYKKYFIKEVNNEKILY